MSRLLFRLRNVPDEEATEVRELLESHDIDYFETFPGNWGISMPALWVSDDGQFEEARRLLDDYQQQRTWRVRQEHEERKARGENDTMLQGFIQRPVRFTFYTGLALVVLYLSISVFTSLGVQG